MDMDRRQFLRVGGTGLVGSSLVALGFSPTGEVLNVSAEEIATAVAVELRAANSDFTLFYRD